jgi:hypothetical protein
MPASTSHRASSRDLEMMEQALEAPLPFARRTVLLG